MIQGVNIIGGKVNIASTNTAGGEGSEPSLPLHLPPLAGVLRKIFLDGLKTDLNAAKIKITTLQNCKPTKKFM